MFLYSFDYFDRVVVLDTIGIEKSMMDKIFGLINYLFFPSPLISLSFFFFRNFLCLDPEKKERKFESPILRLECWIVSVRF